MQHGHGTAPEQVSRRRFLRGAVIGGGAVLLAVGTLGISQMLFFGEKKRTESGVVTVPKDEIREVGAGPYTHHAGAFHLVNTEDGALALSWVCTHLGCEVPWNVEEGRFHCPCHSAIYDIHGARTAGPAPRSLDLLPLTFDGEGNARVNTDRVTQREVYDPSQAVRMPVPGA